MYCWYKCSPSFAKVCTPKWWRRGPHYKTVLLCYCVQYIAIASSSPNPSTQFIRNKFQNICTDMLHIVKHIKEGDWKILKCARNEGFKTDLVSLYPNLKRKKYACNWSLAPLRCGERMRCGAAVLLSCLYESRSCINSVLEVAPHFWTQYCTAAHVLLVRGTRKISVTCQYYFCLTFWLATPAAVSVATCFSSLFVVSWYF
jgi:hypothetical protein